VWEARVLSSYLSHLITQRPFFPERNSLAPSVPVCYRGPLIVLMGDHANPVSSFRLIGRRGGAFVLAAVLLVCAVVTINVRGAWAVDLQIGGEYRARAFDVNNFFDARSEGGCGTPAGSCNDHERFADQRFRLTTTITAGLTSAVVTIDALNTFAGSRPSSFLIGPTPPGAGTGDDRFGTGGFGGSRNAIGLREAYLKIAWPHVTVFAGRHRVVLGHSILFDDVADGFTVLFPLSAGQTQLGVSFLELGTTPTANPFAIGAGNRADLYLGHAQFQPSPAHAFSVYGGALRDRGPVLLNGLIYGLVDQSGTPTVTPGDDLSSASGTIWVVGLAYDGRVGPSTFNLEFDALRGFIDNVPFTGGLDTVALEGFDLLAAQHVDLGPVTVGLTFVYASGSGPDDFGETGKGSTGVNMTDISPNFVLGNILVNGEHVSDRDGSTLNMGGFRGGINQGGAGLFAIKLSVNGDVRPGLNVEGAVIYAKTVDPVIPTRVNPNPGDPVCPLQTPTSTVGCKVDDRLGWEIDLNVNWQVDPNLQFKAGGGMLIADNAFSGLYNNDMTNFDANPITKLFFKAIYRF
jgi:hypothetical protein